MKKNDEEVKMQSSTTDTNTYMVLGSKFEVDKRYEIIDPVGSGAYGVVVAAKDLEAEDQENNLVAIKKIEKAFERYKPTIPGAQICIARKGTILFSKAYGMADMEHNAPLNTESRIEAGSVSKQFTAAAILLLEQEGKLSLDDNVRKYVPELPDYGTPITLRQMMQHTSGLKDGGAIGGMAGWPRSTKTYNNDDALYIASKQKSLNHVPGAEF